MPVVSKKDILELNSKITYEIDGLLDIYTKSFNLINHLSIIKNNLIKLLIK